MHIVPLSWEDSYIELPLQVILTTFPRLHVQGWREEPAV
jgi:hypothetical protein